MPDQHSDANYSPSSQQNLPSSDIKTQPKSQKSNGKGRNVSKPPTQQENQKTDDTSKKNKDKNEIITVLKDLKRNTAMLPKALQSSHAYEKGKKNCETCNMNKDSYKSTMKSVKVIELIVDDIISKEQNEMLDKEDGEETPNKTEPVAKKGEKKVSIGLSFEMYCRNEIDHNLKCVIVKLQNTLGDILMQLSYCKAKRNPSDEKCKKFDVSLNVIEHLKFEYTNLTNTIIQLFKPLPKQNKSSPTICVACLKEQIVECTTTMEKMLKTGRNLKVLMRNDNDEKEKCCSRDYPHVHAVVQDKHVVLKFELPFEVTPPSLEKDPEVNEFKYTSPYDEWPESFPPKTTTDNGPEEVPEEEPPKSEEVNQEEKDDPDNKIASASSKSVNETGPSTKTPEKTPSSASKPLESGSAASAKLNTTKSNTSVVPSGDKQDENKDINPVSKAPEKTPSSASKSLGSGTAEQKKPNAAESETSLILVDEDKAGNKKNLEPSPKEPSQEPESKKDEEKIQSETSKGNDKPQTTQIKTDKDDDKEEAKGTSAGPKEENNESQKPKASRKASSSSSVSDSIDNDDDEGSSDSIKPIKDRKKVSFNRSENAKQIYYMGTKTHSVYQLGESQPQTVFKKKPENQENLAVLPKTISLNSEKESKFTTTTTDNVILAKNKYSISEKSRASKQFSQDLNNKASQNLIKHNNFGKENKIPNLESNASMFLNKRQVNEVVIKDLDASKLLLNSSPAKCCENNGSVGNFKSLTDLPFSASLHSLPLDQDDLDHTTGAVGKPSVLTDETILNPDCDNEWEIEYTDNCKDNQQDNAGWHKAFIARDATSNFCIEIQTDKPVTRKRISKSPSQKDLQNLSTINKVDEDKPTNNIQSKKDKTTNLSLSNKNKSTELRYVTVEYPNASIKQKKAEATNKYNTTESKPYLKHHTHHNQIDRYFKIDPNYSNKNMIEEVDDGFISDDSSNFCCSPIETIKNEICDELKANCFQGKMEKESLCTLSDMMLMFDIIYLDSSAKWQESFSTLKSLKTTETFDDSQSFSKPVSSYSFAQDNNKSNKKTAVLRSLQSGLAKYKPNVRENSFSLLNSYSKNCGCWFTLLNSTVKELPENQIDWGEGNFICRKRNVFVKKSNLIACVPTTGVFRKKSSIRRNKNAINSESTNDFSRIMCSEADTFEDTNRNPSSIPNNVHYKPVNRNTLLEKVNSKANYNVGLSLITGTDLKTNINFNHKKQVLVDSERHKNARKLTAPKHRITPSINKVNINNQNLNQKNLFFLRKPKINAGGIFNSDNRIYVNDKKIKNIKISTQKQKLLIDDSKKECASQQCSSLNSNIITKQNDTEQRCCSFNYRSCQLVKKPVYTIVERLNPLKSKINNKQQKTTVIDPGTSYKSRKWKVIKPEMKFSTIINSVSSQQIPILVFCKNEHELLNLTKDRSFKNCLKVHIPQQISENLLIKFRDNEFFKSADFERDIYADQINKIPGIIANSMSRSNITRRTSCAVDMHYNVINDERFISELKDLCCDVNSHPLIACFREHFRNTKTGKLFKSGKSGVPFRDLKDNPGFHSISHSVGKENFNPVGALYFDTLKCISSTGKPLVLYDFEGQPHTSSSGTISVNSSGEGLLQFGCSGNLLSDFRGKPLFDIKNKKSQ